MKIFGMHRVLIAAAFLSTSVAHAVDDMLPPAKLVVDAAPAIESAIESVETAEVGAAVATATTEPEPAATVPSKEEIAKLPENEIPVLTGAKQSKKAEGGNLSRIMITLGVLTTVVGGAFFILKRWANRSDGDTKSPKIKVLTQLTLGPKKSLAVVNVAGESLLIGVTDHNISLLKTLSLIDDEVPESVPKTFGNALSEYHDEDDMDALGPAEHDEFAMRGIDEIRDRVSRRLEV